MDRGQRAITRTSILVLATVAFSGGLAHAQTVNSAKTGTLDLTTRLQYDTNPNLQLANPTAELSVSERLNFSALLETRNQQFQASGAGSASFTAGQNDFTFVQPDLRLSYSLDAKNSDVQARLGYQETDVSGFFDIDPGAATILISDPGSLRTLSGGATANFGKNSPFSVTASADYQSTEVRNTLDPSLFDTTNTNITGSAGLRFSPVTQGTLSFGHNIYSAEDATQTNSVTTTANFAVQHEIKSALTIGGNLGYLRRDLELNGVSNVRDGFRAGVSVTQAHRSGDIFGRFSYDLTGPSDMTSLTVGANQQLPTGAVNASVTAANISGAGVQFSGSAGYTKQLADGALKFNLNQAYQVNQNDQESLTTRLGFGYVQNVTSSSNLRVDLNYARTADVGNGTVPTQSRATLGASYDRALTPDWKMQVGYQHRLVTSPGGRADSDSVYLSLSRNVQFGF